MKLHRTALVRRTTQIQMRSDLRELKGLERDYSVPYKFADSKTLK